MTLSKLFLALKGSRKSGNYGHAGRPGKRGGSATANISSIEGGFNKLGIRLLVRGNVSDEVATKAASLALKTITSLKKDHPLFKRKAQNTKDIITGETQPDLKTFIIDDKSGGAWDLNSGTLTMGLPKHIKSNQIQRDSETLDVTNSASNWHEGIKDSDLKVNIETVIRHEMGHYAKDKLLTEKEDGAWREVYSKNKGKLHDTFKKEYYSGRESESFAESIALVTHKGYKKGTLPPEVESFILETLNK